MTRPEWLIFEVSWVTWAFGIALDFKYKQFGISLGPLAFGFVFGSGLTMARLRRDLKKQ
jgi:hypothetical protein